MRQVERLELVAVGEQEAEALRKPAITERIAKRGRPR